MVSIHLLDNSTAGWEPNSLSGTGQNCSLVWSASSNGFVVGFRWRRLVSPSGHCRPQNIGLYDNSGTLLHQETVPADPGGGSDAWIDIALSTAIATTSGSNYSIVAFWPDGSNRCLAATSTLGTPPSPMSVSAHNYLNSGSLGFPTTTLDFIPGVDVAWDTTDTTGGGGGTGDPTGDHAAWFSSDSTTNTHHSDLPWRTDANVTALKTLAEGSSGFAAIKGVVDSILTSVGSGLGTAVAGINTALTAHIAIWSADLAATLQSWNDGLVDWFNKMAGLAGGPVGATSGRTAFPTELWTMAATVDFTFQKSWDQPADLYTISLSGIPARIGTVDVDGATWRPRVGWWATRNGDLLGARSFLHWETSYVEDGGRRMQGIVVRTQPGVTGTIEAWLLT